MRFGTCVPVIVLLAGCAEPATSRAPFERTGRLLVGDQSMDATSPRDAADRFLADRRDDLELDGIELAVETQRQGKAGTYVRYGQRARGVVVFDSQIVVLVDDRQHVRALNLAHRHVALPELDGTIGEDRALAAAGVTGGTAVLGIDPDDQLVYRVTTGNWQVDVEAHTGRVLGTRDLRRYVDGAGFVYDPNPVATGGDTTLADDNDATSPALDAQRINVVLPRLDADTGFLVGQWVDTRPRQVGKRASESSRMYFYDRADPDGHFEEVNAYFHIDRAQARIQSLGFTDVNNRVQIANVNDLNDDNSYYDPGTKELSFGTGGVDDAEDADVILHEYGHSIQDDQVPGFGGGDEGAMGEGFGDYLAASFTATLSTQISDPACVADWDAVSYDTRMPPCLRRVDSTKHWPEHTTGEDHDDGEMWSAALYRGRTSVGADVMDALVLEAHFQLSTSETFAAAADAVLAVDDLLNAGAHRIDLQRLFVWQGLLRTISPPSDATNVVSSESVTIENARIGTTYANNLDEVQTYTKPGATALRLHFATLALESDSSCVDGHCDNIYLYNALGDLFQVLGGSATDTLSVTIPGDTVRIRLVTDTSIADLGYLIDRVDALGPPGPPSDAAVGPDAAIDENDSGGCGCRTGESPHVPAHALLIGAYALARRRRRSA